MSRATCVHSGGFDGDTADSDRSSEINFTITCSPSPTNMATVGLAAKIAALDISGPSRVPPSTSSTARPTHAKQPSQPNVAKLPTKSAAPNPHQGHTNSSSLSTAPARSGTTQPAIDIGRYDGGLEAEDEKRGDAVTGEAAEDLHLTLVCLGPLQYALLVPWFSFV
jgi:hypothetical protein